MLDEIRVFVVLVQAGSFTQAAETLETSRSVVSKKLSELEAELGVRLMNRTTRRLSLTEAGHQFYRHSADSLHNLNNAIAEVRSLANEPRGRLQINLPLSFGVLHVAPLMGEFMERYPGIAPDLHFEDRKVELIEPGFDLSLRIADLPDSSLVAKRLMDISHVVVASPAYLQANGHPDHPNALVAHRIASYRLQDAALNWLFHHENGEQLSVNLSAAITCNSSLAIKTWLLNGDALARVPRFLVETEINRGELVPVLPEWQTLQKTLYAVFPRREFMPHKVRVFLDFLEEKLVAAP